MSPEAQRIAIAESRGWTKCRLAIKGAGAPERGKSPYGVPPRRGYEVSLPNYTQDLNAMHEATQSLTKDQLRWYRNLLIEMTGTFEAIDATAAERAEAFLRTIGKWEEGGQL
jgi:hypothetical protein